MAVGVGGGAIAPPDSGRIEGVPHYYLPLVLGSYILTPLKAILKYS